MPEKYPVLLRNIQNLGASATTTIKPPLGQRFWAIFLQMAYTGGTNTIAAAYANITEGRLIVDGEVVRRFTGAELRANNIKYGSKYDSVSTEVPNTAPGVTIPIYFAEDWREDKLEIESTAFPTNTLQNFSIELDLGAATAPVITGYALVDDVQLKDGVRPKMVTWTKQTWGTGAAILEINDILKKGILLEMNFTPPSSSISKVTVMKTPVNQKERTIYEMTATSNAAFLQGKGVTAVSGSYYTVFDVDGLTSSGVDLRGLTSFYVKIEAAAAMAGNMSAIIQRLEEV